MLRPVYTEPENCQDCYKCIRECPVKAIKVEDNKASIIDERCICCGHCTLICPTGAKKVRDGLSKAKYLLGRYPGKVYLSLAPSYVSEFGEIPVNELISAIKSLGFAGVSETALGAELVTATTERHIKESEKILHISSACPVIVEYINKYAPEYSSYITPIVSPMLAHAKMLREVYGEDIKIIFAGPCIGKKSESDNHNELVDVAITFGDLFDWLKKEADNSSTNSSSKDNEIFIPYHSNSGALYPIEGGMLSGIKKPDISAHYMAFSGLNSVKDVLDGLNYNKFKEPVFLELLACSGGCVNGPAKRNKISVASKRYEVIEKCEKGASKIDFSNLDLSTLYNPDSKERKFNYPEQAIKEALASVGKLSQQDELNCSSCGYDSCRDFAVAMLEGNAESNMCASYMRKIAHDKATVLLQKIPAGVILVNSDLKVVDLNRNFALYMGEDTLSTYDLLPGMSGASIKKICPFAPYFETVLTTGEELRERRINKNGKIWLLSIYNIQRHRLVFGILQDLREPAVRKEWILEKTSEVILNQMTTVQKVAGLLGENAAFTDSTLRSIIEAYTDENKEIGKGQISE